MTRPLLENMRGIRDCRRWSQWQGWVQRRWRNWPYKACSLFFGFTVAARATFAATPGRLYWVWKKSGCLWIAHSNLPVTTHGGAKTYSASILYPCNNSSHISSAQVIRTHVQARLRGHFYTATRKDLLQVLCSSMSGFLGGAEVALAILQLYIHGRRTNNGYMRANIEINEYISTATYIFTLKQILGPALHRFDEGCASRLLSNSTLPLVVGRWSSVHFP